MAQQRAATSAQSDLFDIMHTCRAMRRLKPDPVPEDVLLKLVDAAIHAPSSSNAQNWRFIIVRDVAQKKRLQELWKQGWAWYKDTVGSAGPRPGEDIEVRNRTVKAGDYMVDHLHEAPALIFVAVKKDEVVAKALASPKTVTAAIRHLGLGATLRLLAGAGNATSTGTYSTAYPAVQNLLLAARGLGLGAVLTTPHLFHPGAYEKILGVPSGMTLAACIPVGYPMGNFGPVSRPDPRTVVAWDRYTG